MDGGLDRVLRWWILGCALFVCAGLPTASIAAATATAAPSAAVPFGSGWEWTAGPRIGTHPIAAVACPSASLCVAVDRAGNVLTSTDPTGGVRQWRTATVDAGNSLLAVACPSVSLCVALDSAGNVVTSTDPTGGASRWNTATVDAPNGLNAIACPSASLCVAGDDIGNVVTSTDPTGGAAAWTVAQADRNVNYECYHYGTTGPGCAASIDAVSCPSAKECVAADSAGSVLESTDPSAGGARWVSPPGSIGDDAALTGVACPSTSLCATVDGDSGSVMTWTPAGAATPTVASQPTGTQYGLSGIFCASASACFTWDDSGAIFVTTALSANSSWTQSTVAGGAVTAMSCPSTSACLAVTDTGTLDIGIREAALMQAGRALHTATDATALRSPAALLRAAGAPVRFDAPVPGLLSGTASIMHHGRRETLGRWSDTIHTQGATVARLHLNALGRRTIRTAHRFTMDVTLTFEPAGSSAEVTVTAVISVR